METSIEKLNRLFDKYQSKFAGSFHNCLWQLLVNEKRELTSFTSCFVYIRDADQRVGIADRGVPGYTPALFHFKPDVNKEEAAIILDDLNKEIFLLSPEQATIIQASTY